ncbi:riboflavin biosynthesis protein RibF [Effusibacillus lacus]|uniref:Riboflavin biosynthesis protein n=1 Tax=Effusibacillus lacus TaxID=1348429 RepID=A0A292YDT8_9BACL|nr:riboflavin biosynthesis protein RibF [Effusibacillus lacus]TCS73168.1 riboflavin kinase/FMN adenylyltransferase [Effusibacillus lacus]GAX90572.1 bifunctional riboflavin kinase/FMN adenylyltransferase [Effusibacillus lacus]
MKTVRIAGLPGNQTYEPSVMALGNFDGVHKGHRQIVEEARTIANHKGVKLAVMTFDPHPRQVLGVGSNYDQQLTPLPIKLKLLKELNVDICYVIHFDKRFAAVSSGGFVEDYLWRLNAAAVVVGFDYRFGAGGRADASVLKGLVEQAGKTVHIVPAVNLYGEKISSSFIREKLLLGEVKLAAELLGKPYEIVGEIVRGEGRGKHLGFPTANIAPSHKFVLPRTGVYLIKGYLSGSENIYNGLMNVGYKPTFHDTENQVTLEAHLFDFSGDIYHRQISVEFIDFLRAEKKFNSARELIDQIGADIAEAKRRLR